MAKGLRYDDAIKLLGEGQSKTLAAIDAILDGALLTTAAATGSFEIVGLFDAKSQLIKHGHALVAKLGQRARGVRGQSRMDLLTAAHTVIVLTAYFESLPDMASPNATLADQLREAGTPQAESRRLLADMLLRTNVPVPLPHLTQDANRRAIEAYYARLTSQMRFYSFYGAPPAIQDRIDGAVKPGIATAAMRRYDELFIALCRDCPDFALWSILREHSAGRAELRELLSQHFGELSGHLDTALDGLRAGLAALVSTVEPPDWADRLSRHYRPLLASPIADIGADGGLAGLRMPTLEEAYVNPSCRVAAVDSQASVATDGWWERQRLIDDVQVFLTAHLTSPVATDAPLVLLGQPGSGKSVLTKILVAGLPSGDFLPVRVELRQVPAEDTVQDHIEHAVRDATGSTAEWPEVVEAAGGALPVVILDGFDELLQSTRVTQSNYLEQLQKFQHREAAQGRPVAIIVTSRTVVADRVRYPEGTVAVRLEPFSERQIERWLETWNSLNAAYFADRGLRPLTYRDLSSQYELASQPLLMLMLALYDADDNRLPRGGAALDAGELYERLLEGFVRREVGKDREFDERAVAEEAARELHRLSIVAFAMFNRGRTYVHDDEVDEDLRALLPAPGREARTRGFGRTYTEGQLMVGRFFFVHESVATRGPDDRASTYEFLHATFGEYLVARLVARLVSDVAKRTTAGGDDFHPPAPDDSRLFTMLSWTPLTSRYQIVAFLRDLLSAADAGPRDVLLRLFQQPAAGARPDNLAAYHPIASSAPTRQAIYQANLLILLLCLGEVRATDLFPGVEDPVPAWQRMAHLWRAHCTWTEWNELIRTVSVDKQLTHGSRDLLYELETFRGQYRIVIYDDAWWHAGEGPDPSDEWIGRQHEFMPHAGDDRWLDLVFAMSVDYYPHPHRPHPLLRLLVELRLDGAMKEYRISGYREAMRMLGRLDIPAESASLLLLLFRELRRDLCRDSKLFGPIAREWCDWLSEVERGHGCFEATVLLLDEIAATDDIEATVKVVRRAMHGLLPPPEDYLRLWTAYVDAGFDPDDPESRWPPAGMARKFDLGPIAESRPDLLVRLARTVARTGYKGGMLAERLADALALLPTGALAGLTEAEVKASCAHSPVDDAERAITAWRAAREHLETIRG